MRKNNFQLYIKIFFAILFAVLAVFFTSVKERTQIEKTDSVNKDEMSARVLAGETNLNLQFTQNTTFYDALMRAKNTGKITLHGKNYPGLGFFVTDIGSLHSGNGKSLLYYINGKQASVGVSSCILKDGDIIEWKLE